MKRLIVTADDYGMSRGVNDAIDAGIDAGLITTTNVMTNMPFYEEAKKLRETNISVGVHWTISAGRPVLPPEEIPSLVDKDGKFFSYPKFRSLYRKGKISNSDIKKELVAQYERFVEVCGEPDYWNTHQNTHVDFKIFKVIVDIANELGIRKMRSHKRVYIAARNKSGMSWKWHLIEPVKRQILKGWINYSKKKGMSSPYGVVLPLNKKDLYDPHYIFANLDYNEDIIAEFVIHPSTVVDSEYFGSISDKRIVEYEQFTSDEVKDLLKKYGFELVNFQEV